MQPRAAPFKAACGQAAVRECWTFKEMTSTFYVRLPMAPSRQRETGGTGEEPARQSHKGGHSQLTTRWAIHYTTQDELMVAMGVWQLPRAA